MKMRDKTILLISIFLIGGVLFLSACSTENAVKEPDVTVDIMEGKKQEDSEKAEDDTNLDLSQVYSIISELETNKLIAGMIAANDIIEEANFHEMAKQLEAGNIDVQKQLSVIEKISTVINGVVWVEELNGSVKLLVAELIQLKDALIANELAKAKVVAEAVHESQHKQENEFYKWMNSNNVIIIENLPLEELNKKIAELEIDTLAASMTSVNALIEEADFHEMAEQIAEGNNIQEQLSIIEKIIPLIEGATWVDELNESVSLFKIGLNQLLDTLIANDLTKAKESALAVHESQHTLEQKYYQWMAGKQPNVLSLSAEELIEKAEELNKIAIKAGMITANAVIEEADFHQMQDDLKLGKADPVIQLAVVERLNTIINRTLWNSQLQAVAKQFLVDLEQLKNSLAANNITAAASHAENVHESQHDLEQLFYQVIIQGLAAYEQIVTVEENKTVEINDLPPEINDLPEITIEINDWDFGNGEYKVPKGKINLKLVNNGKFPHGIWLPELKLKQDVAGGETIIVPVDTTELNGVYKFLCSVPECGTAKQHGEMIGNLIVE